MKMPRRMAKGQILVKTPFLFIVFVGFAAFAVDVGFYHVKKAQVQTAAEATAFAAAYRAAAGRYSSYDGTDLAPVEIATADLASTNAPGCNPAVFRWGAWTRAIGFYVPTTSHLRSALEVTVTMEQPRFFSQLFGITARQVTGRAVVIWTPYGDVWPMGISSTTAMSGGQVLAFGPDQTNNVPGNKGWLSFNSLNDVPSLRIYINGGPYGGDCPNPWGGIFDQSTTEDYTLNNGSQGASIEVEGAPGIKHGTEACIAAQVNASAVVLVPIWDEAREEGSHSWYKIVGFVPIQLVGPYTGLSNIRSRILSEGPIWFPPTSNVTQSMSTRFRPYLDIVMVE